MVGVGIQSFPKIFHIGESMIQNLFKGEVEITEKLDGSQFDFGITKDGGANTQVNFYTPKKITGPAIVKINGIGSVADLDVSAGFDGILVDN